MADRPYQQGGSSSSYGSSGIDSGYGYGGSYGGEGLGAGSGSGSGKGWGGLLKSVTKSAVSTAAVLGKKGLKAAQVRCGGMQQLLSGMIRLVCTLCVVWHDHTWGCTRGFR
jgi:hypothetical protein